MFHRIDRPARAGHAGRRVRGAAVVAAVAVLAVGVTTSSSHAQTASTVPDTYTAVWPYASSSIRYGDPVEAARGFAVDFAGFSNPVLGEFQQGDARSGEIAVRPNAGAGAGTTTTILLRQLGPDDTWFILGAVSDSITVTSPSGDAVDRVGSPLALAGEASAFEGTVNVEVRQDGSTTPLGTTFVTGSGSAEPGPFSGSITFTNPTASDGALVLTEQSSGDYEGTVTAMVLRIHFASGAPTPSAPATTRAITTTTVPARRATPVVASPRYAG